MDPRNMGIYLTNKKELGLRPENWAHGGNFKTTAKNHENLRYLRNLKNQKIPPDWTKIALARSFFEQMALIFFNLDYESIYFATVAHKWILSLILGL